MGTLARTAWQDNTLPDGSDGTPVNNAELQKVYDAIEGDVRSANVPTVSTKSIIDDVIAGVPVLMGGDDVWTPDNVYPNGSVFFNTATGTFILIPLARIWRVDSAYLQQGTYVVEAMLQVDNAAAVAHLGLFNLTDAPNAAMVEVVSDANGPGGFIYQSPPIVFPAPGVVKNYALKIYASPAGYRAKVWSARIVRIA